MMPMSLPDLDSFLSPRSIAIVGASTVSTKIGAVPMQYLIDHGYDGAIYPVNVRSKQVHGRPAFASLREIGRPVDLAIFAIPAHAAEAALDDAIAAQINNVVMFSAGYAEMGTVGAQAQERFARKARRAGVRVLGPNCLGYMNAAKSVYATFSPVLSTGLAKPGKVGIVSQSGAFGAYAYAMARERGLGLSAWVTTGNEIDIDVADCITWMARDDATQVIMAYLEGCRDGQKLRDALDLARVNGKPVVVVKVGRTELGAMAVASHTAALAGDDAAYDALLRQHGAWRARSIEEFFDIAHCLSVAGLPVNARIGLLTVSGGVGVMMADDAAEAGLDVAALSPAAQEMIRSRIPLAALANPVDVTGQVTEEPELLDVAARAMLGESQHGSLIIFLAAFGSTPQMLKIQKEMSRALLRDFPGRLLIFCALVNDTHRQALEDTGCLCFADPSRAIRAGSAAVFFQRQKQKPESQETNPMTSITLKTTPYSEADALDLLGKCGIPVVPAVRAVSREEASAAADKMGRPVAMKILSTDITHKSDVGGVVLDINGSDAAAAAYDHIIAAAAKNAPGARVEGVLLAPMISGGVECILGVRRDPTLGPIVMLGSGGVNVELTGDVSFRMAPVNHVQAREMVDELKIAPLFHGFRGAPAADVDALVEAIVRISQFSLAVGTALESVELNPFVVLQKGQGALALDAVLRTHAEAVTPAQPGNAVIATLPLFEMARMLAANTARRHLNAGFAGETPTSRMHWVNQFTHTRRLRSPEDKEVVTPNNDTLFTNAWLDLSEGPLIIETPSMGERYWVLGFLDAWTNPWAYAGRRTTGGGAQRLFVHGPRWEGKVPANVKQIRAPGDDVWVIGRILVDSDPADLARVHTLQDQFRILRPDGSQALSRLDTLIDDRTTGIPKAAEYMRVVSRMLERNPPDTPLTGWPLPEAALQEALDDVYTRLRDVPQPSQQGGGWTMAVNVRNSFGQDFETRARVARNWIGTLGVDEAMYLMAEVDADGHMLTGAQRYVLRFPPGELPQVGAFWSITLYRRSDCLLVANPIGRHSVGDRTPSLQHDADGGLSVCIQPDDPGPECNWLPSPADEAFYLTLRLYQPERSHVEGNFTYPPVRRIQ